MTVSGCMDATLVFLVDPGHDNPIRILRNPVFPYFVGDFVEPTIESSPFGPIIRVKNVNGDLLFEW
jgi:hypothetical protein